MVFIVFVNHLLELLPIYRGTYFNGKKAQEEEEHHQIDRIGLEKRTKPRNEYSGKHGLKDDQEQDEIIETKHGGSSQKVVFERWKTLKLLSDLTEIFLVLIECRQGLYGPSDCGKYKAIALD